MDLLNETVLLKAKSTLFNLFIRETSQFLCYERLLNMTYVAYKKMLFSAKCNSGRIAIQWFHIKHYLDYQYIQNSSRIPFGCKKCVFLHDTRLWFPDYIQTVEKLKYDYLVCMAHFRNLALKAHLKFKKRYLSNEQHSDSK